MQDSPNPRSAHGEFVISYEFFPPKTPEMEIQLWETIKRLAPLKPRFVSVTYGAGGSTRHRTHAIVERIARETDIRPAAHLTCVSSSRAEIEAIVRAYWDAGVRHIVALRGDPPGGVGARYEPHPQGYMRSCDLVRGVRDIADFEISVSTYPEGHPESASIERDLDALEAKIDAGATRAITQFFFDNEVYYRFLDKALARGVKIPIVPGIMPVRNFRQVAGFAQRAGASVPQWLADRFEGLENDPETHSLIAATTAADQVMALARAGVNEFHFYTNNRADLVFAICHLLGVRPLREKATA